MIPLGGLQFGFATHGLLGIVVALQFVVSVAEVLVGVGADFVSFLNAHFERFAGFAEQFDRLQAGVNGVLVTAAVVIRKAEIVVDVRARRI